MSKKALLEFQQIAVMMPVNHRYTREALLGVRQDESEKLLATVRLPMVNISARPKRSKMARVIPDNRLAGRMAAEHLLDRGLQTIAYVGMVGEDPYYAVARYEGAGEAMKERGLELVLAGRDSGGSFLSSVTKLPRPVGVVAANDGVARKLVDDCRREGVAVPHEIAIVGVDNDEIMCEVSDVPLTSVDTHGRRVGYEAAALLDRMLDGEPAPAEPVLVPPRGIVERDSSDVYALGDPALNAALRTLHQQAYTGITVAEAAKASGVHRRVLERAMRQTLGRSPHRELQRLRLERARELLQLSEVKVESIATRCGFRDLPYFQRVFKKATGMTPRRFRAKYREDQA